MCVLYIIALAVTGLFVLSHVVVAEAKAKNIGSSAVSMVSTEACPITLSRSITVVHSSNYVDKSLTGVIGGKTSREFFHHRSNGFSTDYSTIYRRRQKPLAYRFCLRKIWHRWFARCCKSFIECYQTQGWCFPSVRSPDANLWGILSLLRFGGQTERRIHPRSLVENGLFFVKAQRLASSGRSTLGSVGSLDSSACLLLNFPVSVVHRLPLLLSVIRISPSDNDEGNSTRRLYPYRYFVEPAVAGALAFLTVVLFVYGGAASLRWYWRVACWLGCIISYMVGFFVAHDALTRRLWWFGL